VENAGDSGLDLALNRIDWLVAGGERGANRRVNGRMLNL
jgi:hypothetical protein